MNAQRIAAIVFCVLPFRAGVYAQNEVRLNKSLHKAVHDENTARIEYLLKIGAAPNAKDDIEGRVPLHVAVAGGCLPCIRSLLKAGADPNARDNHGKTPFEYGDALLHEAARVGDTEIVGFLLGSGADVNDLDDDSNTPLHWAIRSIHADEVVPPLLEAGAEPNTANSGGETPLHAAASRGCLQCVRLLLQAGAEPEPEERNRSGNTPLLEASARGHEEIVQLLLEAGAEPNAANSGGETPLHAAASRGCLQCVRLLLETGAEPEPEERNRGGNTPLLEASARGHEEIAQLLLEAGARQNTGGVDSFGGSGADTRPIDADGGETSNPRLLRKIEPEYSEEARKAKLQGKIGLAVEIWPDGKPHKIRVMRGLGLGLDEKAVDAVRQWRFAPAMQDGEPVRFISQIEVEFTLDAGTTAGSAGTVVGPPSPVSAVESGGCGTELLASRWNAVKDSRNEGELQKFIADYKSCRGVGVLMTRARNLLEDLRQTPVLKAGSRFRDCDACPDMVVIPAGSFLMGSPESERWRDDAEGPVHEVTISEAFAVGVYEVTFEEWDACVADGGCNGYRPDDEGWGRERRPVINVNWENARAYVEWLSHKTGEDYRLLSEAEWEYAARAGTRTQYSFGDEITEDDANYNNNLVDWKTQPVGSYRANGFGLHDVHGNAAEWVQDCWNDSYAEAPDNGDAWEVRGCNRHVRRSRSWGGGSISIRSASRSGGAPVLVSTKEDGFRVARTLRTALAEVRLEELRKGVAESAPEAEARLEELRKGVAEARLEELSKGAAETAPEAEARERFRDCDACPEMVVLPAGSFEMGSPESEEGRDDDEGPVHEVTISEAFAVGVYEVTFEEWDACVADGGCDGYRPDDEGWGRGRRPVINVHWEDAQAYINWLSRKTGEEYRLLSEAEWEYAARAGTTTRYSFGDEITRRDANYAYSIGKTQPVGSYRANGYGLYDMHGNVREWVEDCWNDSYAGAPSNGKPWKAEGCSLRVVRDGAWNDNSSTLRSAKRGNSVFTEMLRVSPQGFRVARTLRTALAEAGLDELRKGAAESAPEAEAGERFRDCDACPEMVVIPTGSFEMGSPESEEGRMYDDREGPQHRVTIRKAFAAGVYEVTFEEWDACVAEGGCGGYRPDDEGWGRGRRPVILVSWEDTQAYVKWLSRKTGEEYRLLSEAEWEYAARAGTTTRYSFGDEITRRDANYDYSIGKTQPVGSYRANGFGLHDMHGNVYEWVQDCRNDSYAGAPDNGDAWEAGDCSRRVWRGGSWSSHPSDLRSALRLRIYFRSREISRGFRVARTLAP